MSSLSASRSGEAWKHIVKLRDIDDELRCEMLIGSQDYLDDDATVDDTVAGHPPAERSKVAIARCIAIVDRPLSFSPAQTSSGGGNQGEQTSQSPSDHPVDTAILVFPPGGLTLAPSSAAVHVLITGEASLSAPKGSCECILDHLVLSSSPSRDHPSDYAPTGQRRHTWKCRATT